MTEEPSSENFYDEIISRIRGPRKQIIGAIDAHSLYFSYRSSVQRNTLPGPAIVFSDALREAFGYVYETYIVNEKRADLGGSLKHRMCNNAVYCTYCRDNSAHQLDHFLPISVRPEYGIMFENLIPCCAQCNLLKSDAQTISAHPILGSIRDAAYITLNPVISGGHVTFTLIVTPIGVVPNSGYNSLVQLIDTLEFSERFSLKAVALLSKIKPDLAILYDTLGELHMVATLDDDLRRETRLSGANHWRTAMYRGLVGVKHWDWLFIN